MNLRLSLRAVFSIGFLCAAGTIALPQDFAAWRTLTAEEEKSRIGDLPVGSSDPSMIQADFNGDGKKDKALIAIRETDGARGLIVALAGRSQILVLSEENGSGADSDQSGLLNKGLSIAEPGSWQANCYDDECFKHPPRTRILKNPGILFYDGPNTVLYFWDPNSKRFVGSLMVH
jgi:hypothetical protein